MRLLDIPCDLLGYMEGYLNVADFSAWRLVARRAFRARHIVDYSHSRLQVLTRPRNIIRRCALCNDDALSQLEWMDGSRRKTVPWCATHIDADILRDIDVYCVRSLGVNMLD